MEEKFSWFKKLKCFNSGKLDIEELIYLLRKESIEGFEIEFLGRQISNINFKHNLKTIKVAILSTNATQPLANATRIACLRENIIAEVYESPIGAINQELIDEKSFIHSFKPDVVILDLSPNFFNISDEKALFENDIKEKMNEDIRKIKLIWELIDKLNAKIIQNTLICNQYNYLGLAEEEVSWSINTYIDQLNKKLTQIASRKIIWLDIKKLSQIVGLKNWLDLRLYYQAKYGFAVRFLPLYTNWLSSSFREIYSLKPKLLILDLDNTMWGGIIGDDGLEGIKLGPETSQGNAYEDFCKYLKSLKNRGVLLAICSKNELSNVVEVFEKHPHMPLKIDDFSCIKCNWNNKANNLVDIANELNLSTSSFVFVDDNPAECDLIRQTLKNVRVIELSEDPSKHIESIDFLNLFNSSSLSFEDLNRQDLYVAKAKFELEKSNFENIDQYLQLMDMKCSVSKLEEEQIFRVNQMQMRTNQFNITTQRLSEHELKNKLKMKSFKGFTFSLKDKFANHGLISYIEYEINNQQLVISDWLMSCRVFSRTLEEYIMNFISSKALEKGKESIILHYIETKKSLIMRDILKKIGFSLKAKENKREIWEISTQKSKRLKSFIN